MGVFHALVAENSRAPPPGVGVGVVGGTGSAAAVVASTPFDGTSPAAS